MSSFFDHLETGRNLWKRAETKRQHSSQSTELNIVKQNQTKPSGIEVAECGFAGYWNIKGRARMVGDLSDNFCAVSAICGGGFSAIAPQMRHTKKRGLIT